MDNDYGEDYDVPLEKKRPFGAGIKRKRVEFVRASDPDLRTTSDAGPPVSGSSVSDLYLNLVLPGEKKAKTSGKVAAPEPPTCAVCNLPLSEDEPTESLGRQNGISDGSGSDKASTAKQRHEASIAHQVCLTHSHPPSALDRSRMGLTYLSSYGWDPDSRRGLGVTEQGVQFPLKPKQKDDTYGLGLQVPKDARGKMEKKEKKDRPLDAKRSREKAEADKRKGERLREMFYGSDDLQKYLGK